MTNTNNNAIYSNNLGYGVDEDLIIYEGKFGIYLDKKYKCSGIIYYKMNSPMTINFKGKILHIEDYVYEQDLSYDNCIIDIYGYKPTYVTLSSINESILEGFINDHKIKSKNSFVDYVDFDIINFDNIAGNLIKFEEKLYAGRIEFYFKDYHIIIDKRYDYRKELKDELRNKNGFIITHTGRIIKRDKTKFKTHSIIDMLDIIAYSLTFICGRNVGICSAKGYNNKENTYRLWLENLVTPFNYIPTWTDTISNHHNIERFLGLMCTRLDDNYYSVALKRVIDWYVDCLNNISLENNIISIQVALESLSYIILVEKENIISKEQFDLNSASKNIKLTLNHLKISYGHSELDFFDDDIRSRFDDGIDLVIYYRNKIVHPAIKNNDDSLTVEDIWNIIQIGTRYIELIILAFISYKGEYSNRLNDRWYGEVELVPWINNNIRAEE